MGLTLDRGNRDSIGLVANVLRMQTFTFRAFRASKLTKAVYALYSHAQLPGAGLLDREGWPEARDWCGRALPRPRGGPNTDDSAPFGPAMDPYGGGAWSGGRRATQPPHAIPRTKAARARPDHGLGRLQYEGLST